MTKKDYELIASVLRGCANEDVSNLSSRDMLIEVSYQLAHFLKKENPLFDKTRFLKACGIL